MRRHPPIPPPQIASTPIPHLSKHALDSMREVQLELNERRIEAIKLYRPMPKQEEFHKCMASERIVIGGNRCLAAEQEIYDPKERRHRKISEIVGPFHVWSLNPEGYVELRQAERPFIKAYDSLYEVTLTNGKSFRCTLNHRVVDGSGNWVTVRDAWQTNAPLYTTSFSRYVDPEAPSCQKNLSRSWSGFSCGSQPLQTRRVGSGLEHAVTLGTPSCASAVPVVARSAQAECLTNCLWPRCQTDFSHATTATTRDALTRRTFTQERTRTTCETFAYGIDPRETGVTDPNSESRKFGWLRNFLEGIRRRWALLVGNACFLRGGLESRIAPFPTYTAEGRGRTLREPWPDQAEFDATHPKRFAVNMRGPSIASVRFLRKDAVWDTHVPGNNNYIMAGLAHAQSGKSACTFMEDARAATGQDPYGKYPKENGNIIIVGRNWQHIGMVVYPMLFKAGAFKMIRDEKTNQWRAFVPGQDDARKAEAKPAPPLIPPRMIKDIAWVQKNAGYLNKAELINGWTIYCFSSEGEPPQGFQADLVHIDEDINNERWVGEMQARLADRRGRFVWSAMPHSKNDALLGLCERAEKAENDPNSIIKRFTLRFLDNEHIDESEKRKNIERWSALGMEELRMRAEGEFTTESTLMYPTFNPSVHLLQRSELPDGQVPAEWTRYVAIDPGHAVMACIFAAVPPDEKFILIYDELYIRQCNALIFGEQFFAKAQNQHFYNWIMDMHGGMLRDLGSGRLPHELYTEELKKRGLKSQVSGFGFMPGSDDIPARTAMVRKMLHIRGDGTTQLKFLDGACPNLMREIKRYRKKTTTVNGQVYVTDEPQTRGEVHACQALEYLCAYEPKYHTPPKVLGPEPWWVKYLADKRRREKKDDDGVLYFSPKGVYAK